MEPAPPFSVLFPDAVSALSAGGYLLYQTLTVVVGRVMPNYFRCIGGKSPEDYPTYLLTL